MVDRYTKAVLTVIAIALCVIALRLGGDGPNLADHELACGKAYNPCVVKVTNTVQVDVSGPIEVEAGKPLPVYVRAPTVLPR